MVPLFIVEKSSIASFSDRGLTNPGISGNMLVAKLIEVMGFAILSFRHRSDSIAPDARESLLLLLLQLLHTQSSSIQVSSSLLTYSKACSSLLRSIPLALLFDWLPSPATGSAEATSVPSFCCRVSASLANAGVMWSFDFRDPDAIFDDADEYVGGYCGETNSSTALEVVLASGARAGACKQGSSS
jgi:hypothetical protein